MPASVASTRRATFLWVSGLPSEQYGSCASCMTARLHLQLLLVRVRDALFRPLSHYSGVLHLKTRVLKLARGTEACVPEDCGSDLPTSAELIDSVRLVVFVVLPLLLVLDDIVHFAAAADDSGWWPSVLCPSSLPADQSSHASGGGPQQSVVSILISLG